MHALRQDPLLFCLGMGGYGRPLPNMLMRLGWAHCLVPFYLRVLRPFRFLRQMEGLRTSPLRRLVMDAVAYTGVGWAGLEALHLAEKVRAPPGRTAFQSRSSRVRRLGGSSLGRREEVYGWTAVRDAESLRTCYPADLDHLTKIKSKPQRRPPWLGGSRGAAQEPSVGRPASGYHRRLLGTSDTCPDRGSRGDAELLSSAARRDCVQPES